MTFPAKQWSDAQVADLAEKCAHQLKADYQLVFRVVDLLLGQYIGLLLRVLGSVGAHHGTVNCHVIWGCECGPCMDAAEREKARMERQGRKSA